MPAAAVAGAVRTSGLLHRVTAGHDPNHVAIRYRENTTTAELTYGQLEQQSNRLAHALREAGIRPGHIVALLLDRGLHLPVAQLAVMKAGATWMPLDPQHPPARLAFQIDDTATPLVLTTTHLAGLAGDCAPRVACWPLDDPDRIACLADHPDAPPEVTVRPDDGAYLIYTSGSTGTPKGVLVSHRAAHNYCHNAIEQLGITPADRIPQIANPAFDVSIFDCFATLAAGAIIISSPREVITDPTALTTLLRDERVTLAYLPPTILGLLDPRDLLDSHLRGLFSAGMALGPELVNRWSRPGLMIRNSYGPTETTVICTDYLCPDTPLDGPVPIGTAMPHHRAYVLDKRLRPVPVGVSGQLYISGTGLALGYLHRPGLTAQRFLPDPYATQPGQRMYATGDLARWRTDGQLEYLGRTDRQIKLRGQRIELGEIEHVLTTHPTIRQCAVTLHDNTYLAAYLITDPDHTTADPHHNDLREHLATRLPTYMIPSVFITLPELPLTPNGKLDTARLPDPAPRTNGHVPPRTDTERWLATTWQQLLGVTHVGARDDFFALGGNSLHGTQLVARIRDSLHVEFDLRHLFTDPTLAGLAARLDESEAAATEKPIVPVARDGALPCTPQQEGLWFLHRMNPSSSVYHMPLALGLHGALDVPALERALHALVVRHEALRTRFVERDGVPRQVIDPAPTALSVAVTPARADRIESWVAEQFTEPFDLAAGYLFRAALARLAPDEHALVLVVHHIVADGWSLRILAEELSVLYAAETSHSTPQLTPLPVQPADHATWQRTWLDGTEMQRQLTYWRETLTGLTTLDFPTDRPRPAQPTGAGNGLAKRIPNQLAATARLYARTHHVSFLAIHQAALLTVLHRYTGQTDLTIGSIFSGRTRPDIEPIVGFFANTLVLRTNLNNQPTFTQLIHRCHETVLNAAAHQDIPFGLIVDTLQPERIPGRNPLFQINLTLQPANAQADLTLGTIAAKPLAAVSSYARFDILIEIIDAPDGLEVSAEYSTELFDADRIERLLDHYITALTHGLATPDTPAEDLDIRSAAEREQVRRVWTPRTPDLLHRVTAGHDPDHVAIRFRDATSAGELTYRELEERSNQLAHALIEAGVRTGQIVALLLDRSLHLPVAELAVMKAGAAWMPLDSQHPSARLAFQVDDTATPLVLTTTDLAGLAEGCAPRVSRWSLDDPELEADLATRPVTVPTVDIRPDDAAYLIYTSGSTGIPKGVLVSHRSAHNYCHNAVEEYAIGPADRIAQVANTAFDVSVFDCFATLLGGGTVIGAPREVMTDPAALATLLREERVTFTYLPPAFLGLLDPQAFVASSLRGMQVGGELLDTGQQHRWSRPGLALHHVYGPTEATVVCINYLCPDTPLDGPLPIGTALPHHWAYILDGRLRQVPVGVPGQLYLAGTGLAHGYLHRPGLSAERFLADPYATQPGQRMYATGDLTRWRADGQIEFLGRIDRQVKLRGQRIELGEIEHVLLSHPGIRQCAVTLRDGSYLAAYLVLEPGQDDTAPGEVDMTDLRDHLGHRLPSYMIPTVFVTLAELPLSPNGKLDVARLPEPARRAQERIHPRTETERWLAATWHDLLGVEDIGADDNFFSLGGNSLHGTQLIARIRDDRHVEVDLRRLFAAPVLEQLAARLDEAEAAPVRAGIVPIARDGSLPCTPQQEGLWFLHRMYPASAAYHIPYALALHGALDVPALQRALQALVTRHEALRTRFVEHDGIPRQIVDPPPATLSLPVTDLEPERVESWVDEQYVRPFDLAAGSLFRAALVRLTPSEYVLALVVHHIVADGWSLRILAEELSLLYAAQAEDGADPLAPLAVQPADHAAWQRSWLDGAEMQRQLTYWRETLTGLSTLDFPADRPRPAQPTGAGGGLVQYVSGDLATAARGYARGHQVSFLAVLQAGLLTVLHRYTGQDDITIGSIFSGRTRAEIEPVVGFFANTLVLRTDVGGEPTFAELVRRCHETILNAAAHQDVPFGLIVDALQPERVAGRNPLFQIGLALQPASTQAGDLTLGSVDATPLAAAKSYARFDLAFDVVDAPDGLLITLDYSTELFDTDRIERLLEHYLAALAHGLATPDTPVDDIDIRSAAERQQVRHVWPERAAGLLHRVIDGHDPDHVAIRCLDRNAASELTYGELGRHANQLAHALVEAGIRPGHVVALLLDRGPHLLVAQLAVMKAGATWMPLDSQHPPTRLTFQIRDTAAPLLLTTGSLADLAHDCAPDVARWSLDDPQLTTRLLTHPHTPPGIDIQPDDGAYLIYTSGSTGTPKGVLVSHRAAHNYCHNAIEQLGITPADRIPQIANPAFDMTIFDCYATLSAGATLVSTPREVITEPAALTALLRQQEITLAYLPSTILGLLDPRDLLDSHLRALFNAGMTFGPELVNRWSRPGLMIRNSYGPTETTVICTDYLCPDTPLDGPVPIGTAMPHHWAYVLDKRLRPVPFGVPGQVYISGTGLALGYLHRPGLTAQRFLPDPFATQPGQRMYATGDLARWRTDGQLEYLGRTDRQIKLRGQRIELGEIEHILLSHPTIRQCAVTLHDNTYLAAYLVHDPDHAAAEAAELREYLIDRLPTHMVPTVFVTLPELPLTSNGKLDVARLPEPTRHKREHVAPRTDTERWLAAAWQDLLDVERVSVDDNFFDLGGNSLHGTQLVARIRDGLRVELDPRHLFTSSLLEQLAARLDESEAAAAEKAIVPVARDGALPCTPQQEGLWFLHRMDPSSSVYHIPFALRLLGALDIPALERALHALVVRHEALRTRFVEDDGLPRQVIDPPPASMSLPVTQLEAERVDWWVAEQFTRPFDLTAGHLLRTAVAQVAPDEYVLAVVVHHIVADGWSAKILAEELTLLYAGGDARLTPLPVQPADHATWQRTWLDGTEMQRQLTYWRETLTGLTTLDFPTDRPRPAQPTGAGNGLAKRIPNQLAATARLYARTHHVSFLAIHQAALLTVLHRYTGQTDLTIGSIFSGRTRPDIEPIVGFFANTLVLRTNLNNQPTFTQLIHRCHETVLNAAAHQDIPFGLIVDTLQPERIPGRNPLFQINLTLQPANTQADLTLGSITAAPVDARNRYARFDIGIEIIDAPDGLEVSAEYSTELFDADRIERLLDHYITALTHGLATPDIPAEDLDIIPGAERRNVLHAWNPAPIAHTPDLLHRVTAGHDPDQVAIRYRDRGMTSELTYGQVEERSNRLAHALREAGIRPGHIVALLLDRGPELPVAQLAVMKAGAAWMPLDPQHPPARLAFQIGDTAAPLVLTTTNLAGLAHDAAPLVACWPLDDPQLAIRLANQPDTPSSVDVQPGHGAYLIYTSGSTGTPKGVLVSHQSAHGYCRNAVERLGITAADRIPQVANPAFDASVFDCFATLLAGATIISAPREVITDPTALATLLHDERVTFSFMPPAFLRLLDPRDLAAGALRGLLVGGEALDVALLNHWSRPALAIHHGYGPTEATVACTDYLCPDTPLDGPVPIGTAMPNHRAYVLNERLQPAPVGVPGELFIAGAGLAHGYLNQPGLTAQRFLPDSFATQPGQRMYATGDLARWRTDGQLEYLGRTDRQIKLRGQRIELGEIEHVLLSHPTIRQCAVTLHDNTYLAAYLVTDPDHTTTDPGDPHHNDLREHLAQQLPTYMIPTAFVTVPELPLTPNGKLDTARLPDPAPRTHEHIPPRTDTERWLATTWQQLLGVENISATDNFFDLGGNSLHATQLTARIRTHRHLELDVRHLFTNPALEQLAARIDRGIVGDTTPAADVIAFQPDGARPPLFFVHPAGGSVAHYVRLAPLLGDDQPFYAIADPGLRGAPSPDDVVERASRYVELIRQVRPTGPYRLGGWSLGGIIAQEMARQLGDEVAIVVALDTGLSGDAHVPDDLELLSGFVRDLAGIAGVRPPDVDPSTLLGLDRDALEDRALTVLDDAGLVPPGLRDELRSRMRVFTANATAASTHRPRPYAGRLVLVSAADNDAPDLAAWQALSPAFEHRSVPGNHYSILQPPHLDVLGAVLRECLAEGNEDT